MKKEGEEVLQAKISLQSVERTTPWSRYPCYSLCMTRARAGGCALRKQHCMDSPGLHSFEELWGTHMERVLSRRNAFHGREPHWSTVRRTVAPGKDSCRRILWRTVLEQRKSLKRKEGQKWRIMKCHKSHSPAPWTAGGEEVENFGVMLSLSRKKGWSEGVFIFFLVSYYPLSY